MESKGTQICIYTKRFPKHSRLSRWVTPAEGQFIT